MEVAPRRWRLYAEMPARLARQVVGDLLFVAFLIGAVIAGTTAYERAVRVRSVGGKLETGGQNLSHKMDEASSTIGGLPVVGKRLEPTFASASEAAGLMRKAGAELGGNASNLGWVLVLCVGVLPAAIAAGFYLSSRLRYARLAGGVPALRHREDPDVVDMLALQGMAHLPSRMAPRFAGALRGWRDGDAASTRALAASYLASLGLKAPVASEKPAPAVASGEDEDEHMPGTDQGIQVEETPEDSVADEGVFDQEEADDGSAEHAEPLDSPGEDADER